IQLSDRLYGHDPEDVHAEAVESWQLLLEGGEGALRRVLANIDLVQHGVATPRRMRNLTRNLLRTGRNECEGARQDRRKSAHGPHHRGPLEVERGSMRSDASGVSRTSSSSAVLTCRFMFSSYCVKARVSVCEPALRRTRSTLLHPQSDQRFSPRCGITITPAVSASTIMVRTATLSAVFT